MACILSDVLCCEVQRTMTSFSSVQQRAQHLADPEARQDLDDGEIVLSDSAFLFCDVCTVRPLTDDPSFLYKKLV